MVLTWLKVYAAIRYPATFHDEIEKLVDVEEISDEDKKTNRSGFLALRKLKVASTEWSQRLKVRSSCIA